MIFFIQKISKYLQIMSSMNKNEINFNTSDNNLISPNEAAYEFKEEPIQLVSFKDDILETTAEAINILTGLKNSKLIILSINGPINSGKSTLANNLINKKESGFKIGEKIEGIWIWGKPIDLDNDIKLLILDCQGINNDNKDTINNINNKLFMLNILLSTCLVYITKGELTDEIINDFLYFTNLSSNINIADDNKNQLNNFNDIKEYLPDIFFINDTLKKEEIQTQIEKNEKHEKFYKLFERRNYLKTDEYEEILNKLKSEMKYKTIQNNIIDGDALFGLLQNYIDYLNNNENPVINSALQNILLSKTNNEFEFISYKFKNALNQKLENKYPMSISQIYKIYYELQRKYINEFCTKVANYLKTNQIGEYLKKLLENLEKELETVLETNKEYYDEWFGMEYKELEDVMNKINLGSNSIQDIKKYFSNYTSTLQTCLNKFLNIPNADFCKNLITILSKIYQEFVAVKLNKFGEEINTIFEKNENNNEIEKLKNEIKKLKEQIDNNNTVLTEKKTSGKNYLELESKLEKMSHEIKEKQKEYENNINIEIQKYKKFEDYTTNQIKEKEKSIVELESTIEKLNQELSEVNQKNIKLQTQIINTTKSIDTTSPIDTTQNSNLNLQNLFINIQSTFMDFKNSLDKLDKENETLFSLKNLENITKNADNRFGDCTSGLKNFFEKQIKELGESYEKEIKKLKDEYDTLNLELTKKNNDINEQNKLKEGCEIKLKESERQINELSELSKSKDELIETQNQTLKVYEDKINEYKKTRENLELSLAQNIYNFKMKEDEFECLFMVIEGIVSRKKEKFEHNLNKLSSEAKNMVENLVKQYKFFK